MLTSLTLKIKPHTPAKIHVEESQGTLQRMWDTAKPAVAAALDGTPLKGSEMAARGACGASFTGEFSQIGQRRMSWEAS